MDFKIEGGQVVSSLPIHFAYRFSNDGGERIKPIGELKVNNLFGFTKITLDANRRDGNVLPGSVRKFKVVWFEKEQDKLAVYSPPAEEVEEKQGFFASAKNQWRNFAFGLYTVKLNLTYGKDNKTADASFWFFVIPWQLLSIIFTILAILGFLSVIGLKKYNRWIISKHATRGA